MSVPNQPTPEQALSLVAQELSASASTPLLDNDGSKFTLRAAVARILWKNNFLLPLQNRPLAPTQVDDQYGHVLSARAEGLVTQAILADLAAALGRDVKTLRANAIASLQTVTTPGASS